MKHILLVCTGNTCRSQMGQGILQNLLEQRAAGRFQVLSAGLAAFPGEPVSSHAADVMAEIDLDVTDQSSQRVSADLMDWADLILTMTESQSRQLQKDYPGARTRIFTLGEYIGNSRQEVHDPFGGRMSDYRRCRRQLETMLAEAAQRLLAQTEDPGVA